ncbi:MAG: polysaccharide deacetylase family protein [Rhodobacteraceae bacterium]|nr:polysaccharide deacetylase family protein [Paracoccaceae bacterium]
MPTGLALTRRALLLGAVATPVLAARPPAGLIEPHMRLARAAEPRVALTLDACDGHVDTRILDLLVSERIAATVFVSGLWLRENPAAFRALLDHPDLFEIGDHGAHHEAAIDRPWREWGVHAAGSAAGITAEVTGGAALLQAAGAPRPAWFRGAAALYTRSGMTQVLGMGYRIAGFSLNGDAGASLDATETARRIAAARDGDVIIAHINQPKRPAGAGVAEGVRALQTRGLRFVRLSAPGVDVIPA